MPVGMAKKKPKRAPVGITHNGNRDKFGLAGIEESSRLVNEASPTRWRLAKSPYNIKLPKCPQI